MRKKTSKSSNFIMQGGILAIAGIISRLIGLIYRIPVTNIIGNEGNGYYSVAYQVYNMMLLISSYSLPLAVSKLVSARISKGQYKNAHKIFKGGILFAFITGGTVCVLIFAGAKFIAGAVMSQPMSAIALRIFAPTLLVVAVMGVIRGYFQGMGTMIPTAVSQIVEQIINAVVSILAAKYLFTYGMKVAAVLRNDSYGPAYGAAGSTIGTSVGAAAGLLFLITILVMMGSVLNHQMAKDDLRFEESYGQVFRIILVTAIPVILSTAIYNLSDIIDNGLFNKIMDIKGQSGQKAAIWGIYSGKYRLLTNVPIALANAMCAATVPVLTRCMAEGNMKAARRKISVAMRFTMIIAFPCAVGLGVLGLPILTMLFKGDLALDGKLMNVGSVSVIFFSISTLTNGVLQGINKMKIPVRNACIALVIHVGALYFMLDRLQWGIYGVVYANILFGMLMCLLNGLSIRKHLRYNQEYIRTFVIPAIASFMMGVIIFGAYKLLILALPNVTATLISIFAGTILYFILILRLRGVSREELAGFPGGDTIERVARRMHVI